MAPKIIMLKDINKINIYRHPIRYKITSVMRKTAIPMTVKMIADEMNAKHGNIFYHVQKLAEIGLIEVVKTRKINGITAKYYLRKYDQIYFDLDNLAEETNPLLIEFNQTIFKDIFFDFLEEVHPKELDTDDTDLVHDSLNKDYYYFDPSETETIKYEVLQVLNKYNKKTDKSKKYTSVIAIGKQRKIINPLIDDIPIDE